MSGIQWKVKLKMSWIGYCTVGLFLVGISEQQRPLNQGRPIVDLREFPVPQSFQQLRIFTPTREGRSGQNDNLRVNQFSHQFFHPVPAPSSQFPTNSRPPPARPPLRGGPLESTASREPFARGPNGFGSTRFDALHSREPQDLTLESPAARKFPDSDAPPFRPEPVGRRIQPLDVANTVGPSERTKSVEESTRFSPVSNKISDSDITERPAPKFTFRPVGPGVVREREQALPRTTTTTTPVPEDEEDYYVYYDEEDLPEELRKLLEEDDNQQLVVERITAELKPTTQSPSVFTTVKTTAPTVSTTVKTNAPTTTEPTPVSETKTEKVEEPTTRSPPKPSTQAPTTTTSASGEVEVTIETSAESETTENDNDVSDEVQSETPIKQEVENDDVVVPTTVVPPPEVEEETQPPAANEDTEVPEVTTVSVTTTEAIKEIPDTVGPAGPFRRPFRPNRFRPAPRRFPERFSKLTIPVDDEAESKVESSGGKTVVSVATTKSIVSRFTESPSIAEVTPRPSVDRGSKAIGSQKNAENALRKQKPADDIGDKLDKFQSDLSDSFLFGGVPHSAPPLVATKPKFTYPVSPLEIIKDLKVGPPADDADATEKTTTVEISTTTVPSSTVENAVNLTSENPVVNNKFDKALDALKTNNSDQLQPTDFKKEEAVTTTEVVVESAPVTTELSLVDKLLAKPKTDSLAGLLPAGFDSLEGLLPPGFSLTTPAATETALAGNNNITEDSLSGLLPPGFKADSAPEKVSLDSLAGLLPPGFKQEESTTVEPAPSPNDPFGSLFSAAEDDISKFLPKDFKLNRFTPKPSTPKAPVSESETHEEPRKTALVFPSKLGKKPGSGTTTHKPFLKASTSTEAIVIKAGWPTRATTEFTGWPTPNTTAKPRSTTPFAISFAILDETTTTTQRTTTTPPPPVPRVNGTCIHKCKIAASLRVIGGIDWSGELANPITSQYRDLATFLKVQLDGVYRSSAMAQYYRGIDIEGFSPGSVIVDYFVHLDLPSSQKGVSAINATDIRTLFHQALNDGLDGLHFGNFTVDPRASSFVVLQENTSASLAGEVVDTALFPSWAIAVIVIGLLSFIFVVTFGVTMLVRRRRVSQVKKGVPLSEEMLNELNKSSQGVDNYAMEDPYDLGPLPSDPWDDLSKLARPRPPPARRPASSTGIPNRNIRNFNPGIYDSWKSEWNGQLASYSTNHYAPGSSYSLSRDLIPGAQARNPEVRRPGSSLANRFNMVHDWGRGFTNTALVNNYTSEWVAATGRNSSLGRGLGVDGGWSHSVLQGSNRSSATRTMRRPSDYDNEF